MSNIGSVGIFIWKGKAYIPTYGQVVGGGAFVAIEPVFVAKLAKHEIVEAIEAALARGHPPLPDRSRDEWDRLMGASPLLAATGARSWSEFYRTAAQFTIAWGPAGVFLESGRRAPTGGWFFDPERRRIFESGVEIADIVDVILQDIEAESSSKKRPSLKPD